MADEIGACVSELDADSQRAAQAAAAAATPAAATPAAAPERLESIRFVRLESADLDAVAQAIGEAKVHAEHLRRQLEAAHQLGRMLDAAAVQVTQRRDQAVATIRAARASVAALQRDGGSIVDRLAREMRTLEEASARLRLVPASSLFGFLERGARDASAALGKPIRFAAYGGDIRVDPDTLTVVQGALLQLIRNAVAHGIEPPQVREAAGKPAEGSVTVTVSRRGGSLVFTCADDGGGIDFGAVRRALERDGQAPDALPLDDATLLDRLMKGGISTSSTVSSMSGRGIGLDVVREAAARMGGRADVRTERGAGTVVDIVAPALVAAFDALLVEAGGVSAAIPLDAVARTTRVGPDALVGAGGALAVAVEGEVVQLRSLASILRAGTAEAGLSETAQTACVVRSGDRAIALAVDQVRGVAGVIMQPLPPFAPPAPFVAGVWLEAAAAPRLVLDPAALVAFADMPAPERQPAGRRTSVLIVDDSLTTRMLEQSILESAGYDVSVAASGEEGLVKARAGDYALFLVDVEMPGMDGFTFVEQVRADPILRGTPVILVTSRASADDRRRGREAGAQGHIAKGDFDQAVLLEEIRALVR
jgi:two-component system chemotaxis sensor kinase CheA